ncbi:hypothetical protein [Thermococcus sp.]|nr:hypothetical protein [Thermococcus sp.]
MEWLEILPLPCKKWNELQKIYIMQDNIHIMWDFTDVLYSTGGVSCGA